MIPGGLTPEQAARALRAIEDTGFLVFDDGTEVRAADGPMRWAAAAANQIPPPPALKPSRLLPFVAEHLRRHPGTDAFLAAIGEGAPDIAAIKHLGLEPKKPMLASVEGLNQAARRMRQQVRRTRNRTDGALHDLALTYGFSRMRGEALSTGSPANLGRLLDRVAQDLDDLQAACTGYAKMATPNRNPPRWHSRKLADMAVAAHWAAYGDAPPIRGWFGDALMGYVGKEVDVPVGHRVIAEAIRAHRI